MLSKAGLPEPPAEFDTVLPSDGSAPDDAAVQLIIAATQWPLDVRFPAVDLCRLALLRCVRAGDAAQARTALLRSTAATVIAATLSQHATASAPLKLVTTRLAANYVACSEPTTADDNDVALLSNAAALASRCAVAGLVAGAPLTLRLACATALLNVGVLARKLKLSELKNSTVKALVSALSSETNDDVLFSLLATIGTLVLLKLLFPLFSF